MIHDFMNVVPVQTIVGHCVIGIDGRAELHIVQNLSLQGLALNVRNALCSNLASGAIQHANHNSLSNAPIWTLILARISLSLISVHILRLWRKESLIDFYRAAIVFAAQFCSQIIAFHGQSQTVHHEPCRLLSDSESTANLMTTHAILAIGQHPHGRHPLLQGNRRIFEYCSQFYRELTATLAQALAGTGTSAGGTATLTGVTVTGGTLKTSGTGVNTGVVISTNSTFNGIANAGTLQVADNSQSFLEGTIDNIGLIQLLSTSQCSNLRIIGNVPLSGSGSLTMLNKTSVWGKTGSEILTNQSTIQGSGNLGLGFMGLVNKGTILANQTTPLTIWPDSNAFNNTGKLSVAKGSTLDITIGPFLNFSGTTLTGGTYLVAGTLQFDNANIVTNAANITLTGTSSQIIDQSSRNALASFATNASSGSFTLSGGQVFAAGAFSNAGRMTISKGSTFTAGGGGY